MKYLLPQQNKLRIYTSIAHFKEWFVDGLVVVERGSCSVWIDIYKKRYLYTGVRTIGHAAARMEAIKELGKLAVGEQDKLLSEVSSDADGRLLRAVSGGSITSLPEGLKINLCTALDAVAMRLGLFQHYGVRSV